jgi:Flp pilus assembly protein TadG
MRMMQPKCVRRGALVPLFAILLIPIMAMLAFSIDVGYICLAKTELQNAADSAALAGVEQLQTLFVQYNLPNQTLKLQILASATGTQSGGPTDTAKKYAAYNTAGGKAITLLDSDVTFGFTDASGNYSSTYIGFPNTISVTARRDSTANGALSLFFGGILGKPTQDLECTSRATIYSGEVTSLAVLSNTSMTTRLLPLALDVNVWKTFYTTGLSPDGLMHPGPNGAPQLQVYPIPGQTSGNFSLLATGPPVNATDAFRTWIESGPSQSDIQYQINHSLLPVSASSTKPWAAGPGLTSTLSTNFADILGKANLIPLFQPVSVVPYQAASGTGNNATYAIEGFASVQVSTATNSGSNMIISLQPIAIYDPTAVYGNVRPAGTAVSSEWGTTLTTFVAPKLTN